MGSHAVQLKIDQQGRCQDEMRTYKVGAVGVEFTPEVIFGNVDLGLVHEPNNLNVVGRAGELHAFQGVRRNQTSSVAGLCAPGNQLSLMVSNRAVGVDRSPDAEIYHLR